MIRGTCCFGQVPSLGAWASLACLGVRAVRAGRRFLNRGIHSKKVLKGISASEWVAASVVGE